MVAIPVNPPWLLPPPVVDLEVLERLQKDSEGVDPSDLFKKTHNTLYHDFVAMAQKIQGQGVLGQHL